MKRNPKPCLAVFDENDEIKAFRPLDNRKSLGKRWAAVFQDGVEWLAQQDVTGQQLKVFLFLLARLDFDNWLRIKHHEICDSLGINKYQASKSLKRLLDLDVIAKGPMAGKYNTYRLNPRIAHRGSKHYASNIVQYDELRKKRAES